MNYKKHYDNLINRALNRMLCNTVYTEHHYIVPKCIGGVNRKSNIVKLLPHEHFVAHQLLVKMYPAHPGLKYALYKMTITTKNMKRNNKQYGWIRHQLCIANKTKAIARWADNQAEKDIYSMRTKEQWASLSDDEYSLACKVRSENQQGYKNSFYGKKHKQDTKSALSEKQLLFFSNMSSEDRQAKITQLRLVNIDGIVYPGLSYAGRILNISPALLHYRINSKSEKWENYTYVD